MPFDDGSTEHCCVFEEVVDVMQGLLDRHLGCKFIFGGDFNVSHQMLLFVICWTGFALLMDLHG